MQWLKEVIISIDDVRIYTDVQYYIEQVQLLYDYFGDSHYQSRYIRLRTGCPYSAYCTLFFRISSKIRGGNFPSPYEIIGDDCRCRECVVNCDNCGKSFLVYEKFVKSTYKFKVHHVTYVPPSNEDEWIKSFAILCGSCHAKITPQIP